MTHISTVALFVIALFLCLAWITIWSRRKTQWRSVAVIVSLASIPLVAGAGLEALSWPRPLWAMYEINGETRVLAAKLVKDVGIFLYLETGTPEPRSIVIDWNTEEAKKIQELMDGSNARGEGGEFMMKWDFELSWEQRKAPSWYPLPQPPLLPAKIPEPEAPKFNL
jgi:hypothetical protein